ncbi:methyl-accepting chemotaxis protein [Marinomonas balearica]|uniref:Methyl-accepting chemotaxis protein n=1 Tax=Marinomonas balearica TaxID=491947 RepID=A0A4R6MGM0_9GAMM|nr:methyl-accepting chemotaxis protein [Marinomonas balearica]TDP00486.1 methyl-accepting chemotaxis protein [Marinomonas balearica]
MERLSILQRIVLFMVVTFSIAAIVNVVSVSSVLNEKFLEQSLNGNRSITMNMADQMASGVRFKKSSILMKPITALIHTKNMAYSGASVTDMKQEILLTHVAHEEAPPMESMKQGLRFEETKTEHRLVEHQLLIATPIINLKNEKQVGWLIVYWNLDSVFESINVVVMSLVINTAVSLLIAIFLISIIISKQITTPLKTLRTLLKELNNGNGDLTSRLQQVGTPELKAVSRSINSFVETLQTLIKDVDIQSSNQWNIVKKTRESADNVQSRLLEKDKKMDIVLTSMNELGDKAMESSSYVTQITDSLNEASEITKDGRNQVEENKNVIHGVSKEVDAAALVVENLSELSLQVSTVMDVIRNIAEQTNLLALNAAIEAARAGEQGRGFAVVADEVRELAGKTQKSTDQIKEQIDNLIQGTEEAVTSIKLSSEQTKSAVAQADSLLSMFTNLANKVQHINQLNQNILSVTGVQKDITNSANAEISIIRDISKDSYDLSTESIMFCDNLAKQSEKIKHSLSKFQV